MDTEGSGQIDKDQFKAARPILELPDQYAKEKNSNKLFALIDKNDDKTISLFEWFQIFDVKWVKRNWNFNKKL